jgi:formylglycine-generating enzyme required for sulfatase activity
MTRPPHSRAARRALGAGLLLSAVAAAFLAAPLASSQAFRVPEPLPLGSPQACQAYGGMPVGWKSEAHVATPAGQVYIAAGAVILGSDGGYADEKPRVRHAFGAFWIDATEVTNAQFAAFVAATGHVTDAERQGGGAVFRPPDQHGDTREATEGSWWQFVKGAQWRHPDGPDSSIAGADHAPVVQVTRADAQAFAAWAGRALPTEVQWEAAAKAGREDDALDRAPLDEAGRPAANYWQGPFPFQDEKSDGYGGRAPVGCFAANGFGLYDTIGTVWEWTADDYTGAHQPHGHGDAARARTENKPGAPGAAPGVIKGGSFLCAASYCVRYRAGARHPHEADLPAAHVGFRTVRAAADAPR